jgi:hypothetical protein
MIEKRRDDTKARRILDIIEELPVSEKGRAYINEEVQNNAFNLLRQPISKKKKKRGNLKEWLNLEYYLKMKIKYYFIHLFL